MTKEEIITTLRGMVKHNEDEDAAIFAAIQALSKPELPEGLDEAAENVNKGGLIGFEGPCWLTKEMPRDYFKQGAEWMAGQGVTKEAVIGMATEEISINVSQKALDALDACPGDKVIVQIRKAK